MFIYNGTYSFTKVLSENINITNDDKNNTNEDFDEEFEEWIKNNTDISEETINKITNDIKKFKPILLLQYLKILKII